MIKSVFKKKYFGGVFLHNCLGLLHKTVMIWVTENGFGLTLGWSGTPQSNSLGVKNFQRYLGIPSVSHLFIGQHCY